MTQDDFSDRIRLRRFCKNAFGNCSGVVGVMSHGTILDTYIIQKYCANELSWTGKNSMFIKIGGASGAIGSEIKA